MIYLNLRHWSQSSAAQAAQCGHLDCFNALIETGADVTLLDDEERTPLPLAVIGNYGDVASALIEAGADPNTP